ncbi:MAG: autotransporter-associated beta strand repeat-containing protein [Akkermansia sp.]
MKLHLPKGLRAALLACMGLLSPLSSSVSVAAYAAGFAAFALHRAQATDYTITNKGDNTLTTAVAGDTITMNLSSGHLYGAGSSTQTVAADLNITQMKVTDGYSGCKYNFNGTLKGSGEITLAITTSAGTQTWNFNGDVSGYTGAISISGGTAKNNILSFGGDSTINAASITTDNLLKISGTRTINSTITAATLEMGAGTNTLGNNVTTDILSVVSGGTVYYNNTSKTDTELKVTEGTVVLGTGVTMQVNTTDSLGYNNQAKVVLENGSTLNFNGKRWTVGSNNNIILRGGSITGTGDGNGCLDFYTTAGVNPGLSAESGDSVISAGLRLRNASLQTFNVENGATLTISGEVFGNGGFKKTGTGTLTISSQTTYGGGTTIEAGSLQLKGQSSLGTGAVTIGTDGTLRLIDTAEGTISGNITNNGSIEVAAGADLQVKQALNNNGTLTFTSGAAYGGATITNAGTLNIGDSIRLTTPSLLSTDGDVVYKDKGVTGINGYLSATYVIATGGSIVLANGATASAYNTDYALTSADGKLTFTLDGTRGDFFINSMDEVVYDTADDSSDISADTTSSIILNAAGATLSMNSALNPNATGGISVRENSTVRLGAESVVLKKTDLHVASGKTLTLTGNGIYDLGSESALGVTLANGENGWTGTVALSNATIGRVDFGSFVNGSYSTLQLSAVKGWIPANSTIQANLKLIKGTDDAAGFTVTGVNDWASYTFAGKISGDGDLEMSQNDSESRYPYFNFTGDCSEWTGNFLLTNSGQGTVEAKFTTATIGNGILNNSDAALEFKIENSSDSVTMKGAVDKTGTGALNITLSGTASKTFEQEVTASAVTVGDGSATFSKTLDATTVTSNSETILAGNDNIIGTVAGSGKLVNSGTTEITNALSNATSVEVTGGKLTLTGGMTDGSGAVTVKKDATLNLKGNTTASAGSVVLEDGAVLTNEGTVSLAGTVTGSGTLKVTSGNSLEIAGSATLGTTVENDGILTIGSSGTLAFSSFDKIDKTGVTYHDSTQGAIAGNGYESGDYLVVKGSGSINGLTTVSVGGADFAVTVDGGNATITNVGTGGLYYINTGDVTYGATNNAADAAATEGLVLNGGNLVMDKALADTATGGIIVRQNGSLTINEGVSLNKVKIESGRLTLKGSGIYNMDAATETDVAGTKADADWTGTVNLSNSTIGSLANLDNLAASGSTLNLDGDVTASTGTTAANMELKDGSSLSFSGTGDSAFSGKLTGTGSIADTSTGTVSFTGDISGWTGSYSGTNTTVKFADNAAVNASISGKSMKLGSGASLNKGATLTDNMTAYDFTLGGSLTVGGDMTATSITIGDGVLAALGTNTPLINVSGSLSGIDFVLGDSNWEYLLSDALGEGAAYKLVGFGSSTGSFTLGGANSYTKDGVKFYIASNDSAVTLTKVTMGPEWVGDTTVGWTESDGFNPPQSSDGPVSFMGHGSALVQVHGAQTVTGINVDAESGVTTYTLTGDSVTTNTLSIIHGNLIIQNELTANGLISIHSGTELTVQEGGTLTGGSMANDGTLTIGSGSSVTVGSLTGDGKVAGDGTLVVQDGKVSEKTLSTNAGTIEMDTLNDADATQGVSGTLLVREGGSYTTGAYNGATSIGTVDAGAVQALRADELLTVIGNAGTIDLTGLTDVNADNNKLGGIKTTGATVKLNNVTSGAPTKVTLGSASSMESGVLDFTVSATEVNNNLSAAKENKPTVITGEKLDLSNTTLMVHEVQNENLNLALGGQEKDILLFVVSDNAHSTVNNVTVNMDDCPWMTKYFTNFRVVEGSVNVVADANTGLYAAHGQTPNGTAGLALAGKAMFHLDPQTQTPGSELAQVLDMLDNHITSGNTGAMDRLGAALAGSSLSAVGLALADDVQRQLRAIRNRTTTMGVNECVVNEDMPYVNGWISGDGNYRQLSESGTDAGYQVSSWGGTVGVDVDVNPNLTLGVAVSALFGDYTGKAADTLTGDLDTQYVSLFARVSTGSWVNTFVGTLGRADVDLERTLPGIAGKTTYKTNGMMFGFLYEVARTFALNEDASTCVQPLFNMSFTHTSLDSATEGGAADTRLTTDSASLTQFSLGLGGRLQSIVGENEYNRASIFEARALLKLDFGDRYNKLNTALAALPNATVTTRSNESGVIGGEVGATLTIPLSQDAGSVFFDVNADFRADEVGVNGSVGYRVNF